MIEYKIEHIGMNGPDQHDYEIGAWEDGKIAGYIAYSEYNGEIHISDMLVAPWQRRKGIATGMINAIQKANPGIHINSGMRTEDGDKFWQSLNGLEQRGEHHQVDDILSQDFDYIGE
jgi:hypothetical protein